MADKVPDCPEGHPLPEETIKWREHHKCENMRGKATIDEEGRCLFCKMNAEVRELGYEYIPFDVPGVYDPAGDPHVLIQRIDPSENN